MTQEWLMQDLKLIKRLRNDWRKTPRCPRYDLQMTT
jgi:hypothetical protein